MATSTEMAFTATDFLISIPIAAALIGGIKLFYKKTNRSTTPMGCFVGCVVLFWFVLCFVGGVSKRKQERAESHLVKVTLVSSRKIIKVPKCDFIGNDTVYRNRDGVYKNDTGKDLVKYSVKYTKNGYEDHVPIGLLIKPNEYFLWNEDGNSYMFQLPPQSTSVTYRSSYGKSNKLDFTYLEFLDYADRVANDVNIVGYTKE